jgi:sugar/nucleoside kinase (ribokinase family)
MQKYINITGLGNALLDIQYEVSIEELEQLGLNKGEMKLVGSEEQIVLLNNLHNKKSHRSSGGSAANTIIAFSNFGGKAAYQTVLGNDEEGDFYANEFKQLGVRLAAHRLESEPTGICVVLITPDSERTMITMLGASAKFTHKHLDEETIAGSDWLYIEGYELSSPTGAEACLNGVGMADNSKGKTALTFSDTFVTEYHRQNVEAIATRAELIFCNEGEAMSFTQTDNFQAAFKRMSDVAPNYIITRGKEGAIIKWKNETIQIPSYPAQAIDSTGAGDMFAGAFFFGLLRTGSPEKAGHLASFSSSRVVSQFGARLQEDHKSIVTKILG